MAKKKVKKEAKKEIDVIEKQLRNIFIFIGILIVIFILVYFTFQSMKKFEFAGLKFEKIMIGKIPFYYTKMALVYENNRRVNFNLYLRNDPRKQNVTSNVDISFSNNSVYLSLDKGAELECENRGEIKTLMDFISGMGYRFNIAFNDQALAITRNAMFMNCENRDNKPVIMFKAGDKTEITQDGECYILSYKNCETREVTERFILQIIAKINGSKI